MRQFRNKIFVLLIIPLALMLAEPKIINVGDKAKSITLFRLNDHTYFRTKDLLGKKHIVISFFATWCGPCTKELPYLIQLSEELSEDDFEFVLIDLKEKQDKVQSYVDKMKIPFQIILDKYGRTFESYGGESLPLVVVIDKDGMISYYHTGYVDGDEIILKKHLESL
jgi:thiol-disulfide isomerase/thioredoxin